MQTNRDFADRALSTLKMDSKDRFVSRRLILKIARDKMVFLLTQKLRDMSLYREENVYTDIPCIEMKEINKVSCPIVEFKTCSKLMRSKKKLPELMFSRFGDSIRMVSNIDNSIKIDRTNPLDYIRNKKRKGYREKPYYYTRDGYLYIVDSSVEVVNVQLITIDKKGAALASCEKCDECISVLDYEFIGSDKLKEVVYQETIKELMGVYLQIPADGNPDLNEQTT
jgi:hypothetical protein